MDSRGGRQTGLVLVVLALLLSGCAAALTLAGAGPAAAAPLATGSTTSTTATAPPPANDDRDNAQPLGPLPATATGTTAGSTLESDEPGGDCYGIAGSVWYSVSFGTTVPAEAGLQVDAGGNLDACVDVFMKQRSESIPVQGADTDKNGVARLTFSPQAKTTYLIRVGQLEDSDPGSFTLSLFDVPVSASAPGPQLPAAGARGKLDSFFTTTAAYSTELSAAVTYKVNLVNRAGGCMHLSIYDPGTTDFEGATPIARNCAGYQLFTPTETGRYSFLVGAVDGLDVEQPFSLVVEPASALEMAPGVLLDNLTTVHGRLRGNVDDVVRLYRMEVTSRSELTLTLEAHAFSDFDLELLSAGGRVIDCDCGSSGAQVLQEITRPGTYYAAVKAENFSFGQFRLRRQSRTITGLRVYVDGHRHAASTAGDLARVTARIRPAVTGSVTFELEYFDPLSGWQYRGEFSAPLIHGLAEYAFTPPYPGRWRATASFTGTTLAAPATTGFAYLTDAPVPGD